jgi:hypothetical protein
MHGGGLDGSAQIGLRNHIVDGIVDQHSVESAPCA